MTRQQAKEGAEGRPIVAVRSFHRQSESKARAVLQFHLNINKNKTKNKTIFITRRTDGEQETWQRGKKEQRKTAKRFYYCIFINEYVI